MIVFEEVSKRFSCGMSIERILSPMEVEALSDITIEHPPAECLLVNGPSGSGKSVFLNLVAGFYSPDSGRIRVNGFDPANSIEYRKKIALVRCGPHYFDVELSARANLSLLAGWYGLSGVEREARVDESLEFIGIDTETRDVPVGELSAGILNQVSLAGGLIPSPDLLLLDEPTRYLDKVDSKKLKQLLKALAAQGMTLIVASSCHDLVEEIPHRVLRLEEGKKVDYYGN